MTKQPTLTKADLIEEVLRVTELARKESETIVETIFDSIIGALQKRGKDRDSRLWQLSHPRTPWQSRAQPQDRGKSGSAGKKDSLLQAQQRAERLRKHRRRRERLGIGPFSKLTAA